MKKPETIIGTDSHKAELAEAARRRYSCRRYVSSAFTSSDRSALSYLCGRCALPGVTLIPLRCDESLFCLPLVPKPVITGVTACTAVAVANDSQQTLLWAGFSGELLVLELTLLGLSTCWVTGTFRRKAAEKLARLPEGYHLIGLIAVGRSPADAEPPKRTRRDPAKLCAGKPSSWKEDAKAVPEIVSIAPSALNRQPWRIKVDPSRLILDADQHSPRTALDTGIAMCHAELVCLGEHTWNYAASSEEPYCWAE